MASNFELYQSLLDKGILNMRNTPTLFSDLPEIEPDPSKVEGLLLGIAIGDALGNTSESLPTNNMNPHSRRRRYGWITDYLPNKHAGNRRIGLPSDDTQLAFDTLIVILHRGYLDLEELASTFASHRIFGIGGTVKSFLRNYKEFKMPWYRAGIRSSGNGALMRISPILVPYIKDKDRDELWANTVLDTMMTHNDELAIASSLAFIHLLANFMGGEDDPERELERVTEILEAVIGDKKYRVTCTGEEVRVPEYVQSVVESVLRDELSVSVMSEELGSSGYILETLPTSLSIIMRYKDKPVDAILNAVNHTYDNDTIAAIVGTAMGALYGKTAFKDTWIRNLSGRIRKDDDGTVFKLIELTKDYLQNTYRI
jgi:ADP-ribosyl-[dinitrogen reductase] hydrolase